MCRYQTLFYKEGTGYIVRCAACNNFQFAYGNIVITVTAPDFVRLTMFLRRVWERYGKAVEELQQPVAVPTPHEGIRLLLSGKEIEQVYCMLENADTEWRSQQLLELFE
jgi:hypothetical protein